MTAEIAVLNKEAIALAADSAVTISGGKIYNSANKLFCLSFVEPIGIMISGNAQYMQIPWETIIKTYRKELGKKHFSHVSKYGDNFIKSLDNHRNCFSAKEKRLYTETLITSVLSKVHIFLNNKYEEHKLELGKDAKSRDSFSCEFMADHCDLVQEAEILKCFSASFRRSVRKRYSRFVKKAVTQEFSTINKQLIKQISKFVFEYLFRRTTTYSSFHTEVVIGGFGRKELLPAICSYGIDGLLDGHLRYWLKEQRSIKSDGSRETVIIPFAQTDMVHRFMEGVDEEYQMMIESYTLRMLHNHAGFFFDSVKGLKELTRKKKKVIGAKIMKHLKRTHGIFVNHLKDFRKQSFIMPVLSNTCILPKAELAHMAEALVNLTSLQRRVSIAKETVGGPVDVAIITKGDGFVWIKRKHYFNPDLNHHYFRKYYNGILEDDTE